MERRTNQAADGKRLNKSGETSRSNDRATNQKPSNNIHSKRSVPIEVILFLYCVAVIGDDPLLDQYVYRHYKSNYPILRNISGRGSSYSNCDNISKTDPVYVATQSVQSDASKLHSLLTITSSCLSFFTALIYGAYSDRAGRRPVLLLPCLAAFGRIMINMLTIYFNWSIYCLLIGQILNGFCGGFSTFLVAVYSYIFDVATIESRGWRIILADALLPLSSFMANFVVGYTINAYGYLPTYCVLWAAMAANLLLLIFFVPETVKVKSKNRTHASISKSLSDLYAVFTRKEAQRHRKLFLIVLAFFLCGVTEASEDSTRVLFVLNIPLCWGPVYIGWYFGLSALVKQFGGVIGFKMVNWFLVPEIWIAFIGFVSVLAGSLVNAWATTLPMMAAVPLLSMFVRLPQPLFRTIASRLVSSVEQATVLSGLGSVGSISYVMSAFVMNPIYRKTLFIMPGFIFLINAFLAILAAVIILIFVFIDKEDDKGEKSIVSEQQVLDSIKKKDL